MTSILVIDDDSKTRKFLRAQLEAMGFHVEEAADGSLGLERFRAAAADLVVVDIFMPNLDGLETIAALRQQSQTLPIIAMSAGGAMGPRDSLMIASEMGASLTLVKPFPVAVLLGAIRQLLGAAVPN